MDCLQGLQAWTACKAPTLEAIACFKSSHGAFMDITIRVGGDCLLLLHGVPFVVHSAATLYLTADTIYSAWVTTLSIFDE
jgi:hypothetical protein